MTPVLGNDDQDDNFFESSERSDPRVRRTERRRDLLTRYMILLQERPLLTKSVSSAVIGALGSLLGSYSKSSTDKRSVRRPGEESFNVGVDWAEVFSFALYGGLVGGPVGHFWEKWMNEQGPESQSQAMLLDQLIAQPPRLLFMYIFLDMARAAAQSFPAAWNRSWSSIPPVVATSWRVWPVAVYLMLRFLKKRRHYKAGMSLWSVAWVYHLARRRVAIRQSP